MEIEGNYKELLDLIENRDFIDVLVERYVTPQFVSIFQKRNRNILEREFWVAVMKGQRALGVPIPAEDIVAFESAQKDLDFDFMYQLELKLKHDIKTKIQAFVKAAMGYRQEVGQHPHKELTSRDLSDNVEQIQIRDVGQLILGKYTSALRHFTDKADEYRGVVLTARTHHQPAEPTLLGRRFSMWAEELLGHIYDFENFLDNYPWRGIKGPTGTMIGQARLLGSYEKALELERMVANHFGFHNILHSPGQVYPRSLDYKFSTHLVAMASACMNFGTTMRLMAGLELVTEGFKKDQVGSTAMPHKINTRSSERICGAGGLVQMYSFGLAGLCGNQWEEGDVSCSIVRRVALPGICFATDALCETTLTVQNEMGHYPEMIGKELARHLPFLKTTAILSAAMKAGLGREDAHKIIKDYAVMEALKMREGKEQELLKKLADDERFAKYGITPEQLEEALRNQEDIVECAGRQIDAVIEEKDEFIEDYDYHEQAKYEPQPIL